MFHHSLALERRASKERLERRLSKESQSALLEANLKAKDASPALHLESSPVSTIPNLPSENDLQSLASAKSASIHGRSTPSESSRRRQKHTTFADQKQQQLEHICYVPSRDELTSLGYYRTDGYYNTGAGWGGSATRGPLGESDAEGEGCGEDPAEGRRRRVLASIMGGGEEAAAVLERLRSTAEAAQHEEEDEAEEAALRAWCREQQEAARKTWGVKGGDAAALAAHRQKQLRRWEARAQGLSVDDEDASEKTIGDLGKAVLASFGLVAVVALRSRVRF
mmetsp:Transcript_28836/g.73130  ORF Transcript_28836/g.73130 Transcript_28836/m.73130 type:complete len:280 (-) Transcript_28836:45-884(-)